MPRLFHLISLYILIFLTGASGLIYQVTWQKYLSRILGSDTIATSIILATFLGGLSFGYFICGKWSVRVKEHLKSYALLEAIIGIWCFAFPYTFNLLSYITKTWSFSQPLLIIVQGIFCSLILMGIPTICMGGTIPLLTRGISKSINEASYIHARIYAINTFGACFGALCAGFILIPSFGLSGTMKNAAFLNISAAVLIFLLEKSRTQKLTQEEKNENQNKEEEEISPFQFPQWVLYLIGILSGFYVMTLENIFIRLVNFSIGSSSYSFSLIVSVFILSIAAGSYFLSKKKKITGATLLQNQLLIVLALFLLYISLDSWPYWAHLIRITFQPNPIGFWGYYSSLFLALTLIFFIPVGLMGATLPILFHELKQNLILAGKHSGYLFSFNTLGSLAGSIIGGVIFFYYFDLSTIFLIALLSSGLSAAIVAWCYKKIYFYLLTPFWILLIILPLFSPFFNNEHFMIGTIYDRTPLPFSMDGADEFFKKSNENFKLLFKEDDPVSTVGVTEREESRAIIINGKPDSSTSGDIYTLKLTAHIPALLGHSRKRVMVIGMGTGVTAGEFTLYDDIKNIDIVEISPSVIKALPLFKEFTNNVGEDPRVTIHLGDALRILSRINSNSRSQLKMTPRKQGRDDETVPLVQRESDDEVEEDAALNAPWNKWDIICSEPSNPWVNGVDLLFSKEFYKLVKERLNRDGVFLQWLQTYDSAPEILGLAINTLEQEFQSIRVFFSSPGDILIMASDKQIDMNNIELAERTLSSNMRLKKSLSEINLASIDSLLLRELWNNSNNRGVFSNYGIESMDDPRILYMAGKKFFYGDYIPHNFIFNMASAANYKEYLLTKKYPSWKNSWQLSASDTDELLSSTVNNVTGEYSPMTLPVQIRSSITQLQIAGMQMTSFKKMGIETIPFISTYIADENIWGEIDLKDAPYRLKAEKLLASVYNIRNWIVPIATNGLEELLKQNIYYGNDIYEKNWSIVQLAYFYMKDERGKEQIKNILQKLVLNRDGELILKNRDTTEIKKKYGELLQYLKSSAIK